MPLVQQTLRICTAAFTLGVLLLLTRGVPKAVHDASDTHVCSATPSLDLTTIRWIAPGEARDLLGDPNVVFVDCRATDQFQSGHISGAISMPSDREVSVSSLALLHGAQTIIAYCDARGGCESSQRLAARLREIGLPDVRILSDGLPGWLAASYPAESGPCRSCVESIQ